MVKIFLLILTITFVYAQKSQPTARVQASQKSQVVVAAPQPKQEVVTPTTQTQAQPQAQPTPVADPVAGHNESALPLPRFVALRATANMHVGPGQQYPVDWQYVIPSFPMEVLAEFGHWRQVRDFQGNRGWLHKSLLTGKRYVLVVNNIQNMMNTPHAQGKIVARLSPGVIGRVVQVQGDWCKLNVKWEDKSYKGWVEKRHVWGVYGHETHF